MRLVTFSADGVKIGALVGDEIVALDALASTMLELIEQGASGLEQAAQVIAETPQSDRIPLRSVKLLAPIPRPTKNIFCLVFM